MSWIESTWPIGQGPYTGKPGAVAPSACSGRIRAPESAEPRKYCPRHEAWEPLDKFGRDKDSKDGLTHWCNECKRAAQADSRERTRMRRQLAMLRRRERLGGNAQVTGASPALMAKRPVD